jgi:BirA family biotin operon repressor/biotin-[acetyl-CoA-carboxylase] ligase
MRNKVLAILRTSVGYVSGESISRELGISRAAVWKHIKALTEEGYAIEGVSRKGYRLMAQGGLRQFEIEPYLKTKWLGRELLYLPETASTNNIAKNEAEKGAVHGLIVLADRQNAGKGRLGRTWVTETDEGICLSVLLRPPLLPSHASLLTLATAVAVAKAFADIGVVSGIKWPNDLLVCGKKLCGILTEMKSDMDRVEWVVVGIGINVMQKYFPTAIADVATSLYLAGAHDINRSQVAACVLNRLEDEYERLFNEGFATIHKDWLQYSVTIGRQVKVNTLLGTLEGKAVNMDDEGYLLIEKADGETEKIVSGDVILPKE